MAIFHCRVKQHSRRSGSATARAAYRACCLIKDQRTGEQWDYRRKSGLVRARVFQGEEWTCSSKEEDDALRAELWNRAEAAEKRCDAQTAFEIEISLPEELDAEANWILAAEFARSVAIRYGFVAADVAYHCPGRDGRRKPNADRTHDNPHAHILFPTRDAQGKKIGIFRAPVASATVTAIRRAWADACNAALAANGIDERITASKKTAKEYRQEIAGLEQEIAGLAAQITIRRTEIARAYAQAALQEALAEDRPITATAAPPSLPAAKDVLDLLRMRRLRRIWRNRLEQEANDEQQRRKQR